ERHLAHGREEMQADDPLRRTRLAPDLRDRQGGRVRRDHRLGPEDLLELADHTPLGRDVFEHRLDDEIRGAEPRQIRSPGDAPDDARRFAALEAALLRRVGRALADRREPLRDARGAAVALAHAEAGWAR